MIMANRIQAPFEGPSARGTSELFERRWKTVWSAMERRGIGAIAVYGRGSVGCFGALQFLTGHFAGPKGAYGVMRVGRPPVLVAASPLEEMQLLAADKAPGVTVAKARGESSADAAGRLLAEGGDEALGLVSPPGGLLSNDLSRLRRAVGSRELVDATPLVDRARATKSREDVLSLMEAVEGADAAIGAFANRFEVGISEREAAAAIDAELSRWGALTRLVFVSAGTFYGRPPGARPLRAGEPISVLVEFAAPTGHWVEVGVIAAAGDLPPDSQEVAEACIRALREGGRSLNPGTSCGDVADAMEGPLRAAGGEPVSGLGHGTGIDEEQPMIVPESPEKIGSGSAFALHPSCRKADRESGSPVSAIVADTMLVGDSYSSAIGIEGARPLSSLPFEILEVS